MPAGPGRPKGMKNKATTEFKEQLNKLLETASPFMVQWLQEIEDPYKRFDVLSKFAEYIHPKLSRAELTGKDGNDLNPAIIVLPAKNDTDKD